MTNTDFDSATLPKFLRRETPSIKPRREPEAAPRAVAVEPPEDPADRMKAVLHKLEAEMKRNPLDEIAKKIRALTYGEMIELAEAIWKVNAGVELTQEALPAALHRWSVSRG